MKATLETVTGITINRDIDTAESPMGIIRKFYEDDATAATQIFSKQYIRSRDAETPFQVMSYSTMTFQESEIYGEDVLEDTECNVEESAMQRMDIERVRTALKMLAPEERAIIQDFFFTESPIPVKELVEKYAMPKTSIYRKRDDALKKLKKILGNA